LPLVFLVQLVAKLFPALKAAVKVSIQGGASDPLGVIVLQISVLLPILFAAWLMSNIEHRPFGDYGLQARDFFGKYYWQGIFWGLATEALVIVLIWTFRGFSFGTLALDAAGMSRYGKLWALAFALVGLQEDFLYRGYLLFTLSTGIRFWPAAIVTSLIFGAVHLSNPGENLAGTFEIMVWALVVCFTIHRTGSLWFAAGFHAAGNFAETFLFSVNDSSTGARGQLLHSTMHGPAWLTGGSVGPEGSVFSYLAILLFALAFHLLYRKSPDVLPA
jgi:membrane protease YdiL (CAAX protease family)